MKTSLTFLGEDITVEYDYQPYEAPSKDGEYPGCPEEYSIVDVLSADDNSIYSTLSKEDLKEIDQLLEDYDKEQLVEWGVRLLGGRGL